MMAHRFFLIVSRLNLLTWIATTIMITLHLWWSDLHNDFWVYQSYALLGLGIFQLVSSLLPLIFWKGLTQKLKLRAGLYWIGVLIYFGFWWWMIVSIDDKILSYDPTTLRVLSISVAMLLGLYLITCLHRIQKSFHS